MILVAGGDSMIWGSDLTDCYHGGVGGHSQNVYPALLAKESAMEYVCAAYPGNSNDAIARMTMLACDGLKDKDKFALVTWTFTSRFEFMFDYNTNNITSPWASVTGNETNKLREFSQQFFRHVGTNYNYQVYNTLRSIILLQTYFKEKKIPYMFTLTDNTAVAEYNDPNLKIFWEMIDWNYWFFFPKAEENWLTTAPRGFYQWAIENKYSMGHTNHPLEQAHLDAVKLIKEKFNELVKKHY
jgi:hypothetical protein